MEMDSSLDCGDLGLGLEGRVVCVGYSRFNASRIRHEGLVIGGEPQVSDVGRHDALRISVVLTRVP